MNNENGTRCTTVLLADARVLEDKTVFSRFLPTVNAERQRNIARRRLDEEKVLALAGGLLLDMLLERWGIQSQIEHDAYGKPRVRNHPEVYVSLTHSYPYAAAVIADHPCGIDVENRGRDLEPIVRRFFTSEEQAYARGDPARSTDIWCRKECCIKYDRPRDVRYIDTFAIPQDYCYRSFPLEGFSFEVLAPKGACAFGVVTFDERE